MIVDYEAVHEDLRSILEDLVERNRTAPIIVEGERDVRALRALGVVGEIRPINRGSTLFRLCEDIARDHREAVILTDWDVRGGRLARQLRDGLAANAVRYDDDIRARLAKACRKEISDVESLDRLVGRVASIVATRERSKPSKRYYAGKVLRWSMRRTRRAP
jgi:dTMP kinase